MNVGQVLDDTYRAYLYPPDAQPVIAWLDTEMDDTTDTITFSAFTVPEDEYLLRAGVLIEIDRELVRVRSWDAVGRVAEVTRSRAGTLATSHTLGAEVILSPPFARQTAFDRLAANLLACSPRLYTVRTELLAPVAAGVAAMPDPLAVSVVRAELEWPGSRTYVQARIVDYHQSTDGRAVILDAMNSDTWVTWRRRMQAPTLDTDELEDLGFDESWVIVLMVGVASDMLVGKDIPKTHADWVASSLEAEGIRVGTRQTLAFAMTQYRDEMIKRFAREMDQEYEITVEMKSAFSQVTRGGYG